jgi:hypothetical protein
MSVGADRNKSLGPRCPEGGPGFYYVAYVFVYLGIVGCNYVVSLSRRRHKRPAAVLRK